MQRVGTRFETVMLSHPQDVDNTIASEDQLIVRTVQSPTLWQEKKARQERYLPRCSTLKHYVLHGTSTSHLPSTSWMRWTRRT
jgi:hypothetical protein